MLVKLTEFNFVEIYQMQEFVVLEVHGIYVG